MRDLGLNGLSEDRRFLSARDITTGEKFRIPADHRLTSLIGTQSRPGSTSGQMEIRMPSSLSPRDIQTRIRRGESPQSVADSAGVAVEQIAGFAGPVLAERAFMCEQARKTSIRRKHVSGAGVMLGALVDENIVSRGGVPESAAWDAWRREDGRWNVAVTPEGADEAASFLFDVKRRYVVPADELAHDLVGDFALAESADMAIADAVRAPQPEPEAEPQAKVQDKLSVEATGDQHDDHTDAQPALPSMPNAATSGLIADMLGVDDAQASTEAQSPPSHPGVSSLKDARDRRALEQLALTEVETPDETELRQPSQQASASDHHRVDDFEDDLEHDVAVPDTMGPRKKRH